MQASDCLLRVAIAADRGNSDSSSLPSFLQSAVIEISSSRSQSDAQSQSDSKSRARSVNPAVLARAILLTLTAASGEPAKEGNK